jgi:hypothetical protein
VLLCLRLRNQVRSYANNGERQDHRSAKPESNPSQAGLLAQTTNHQLSQNKKILHGMKVCRKGLGFGLALRRLEGKSIASLLIKTGS